MKMKSFDVKTEVTGTILLEVTPQELANITASVGKIDTDLLPKSTYVNKEHLLNHTEHHQMWKKLSTVYKTVFGGNR